MIRSKKTKKKMSRTRRRFLQSVGASAFSLPIAGALMRSRGIAQERDVPVRFLAVRSAHGTDRNRWIPRRPDGSEPGGTDVSLDELTFDYQYSLAGTIEGHPLKSKITVLDGLDRWANKAMGDGDSDGHFGAGAALTGGRTDRSQEGRTTNASLDNVLFDVLPESEGPFIINASCFSGGNGWKGMSFRADGTSVQQARNPGEIFGTVFRGFMPDPMMGPPPVDYSGAQRGVYDHVINDLRRLHGELTGAERMRLGEHLEAMERLHAQISDGPVTMPRGMCSTTEADNPGAIEGYSAGNWEDVELCARRHASVIAQAFACGRSRVATLMHLDDFINPYFGVPAIQAEHPGLGGEFHDPFTHRYWNNQDDPFVASVWSLAQRWQTQLFLMTLEELDSVIDPMDPSGTHTILDNTIVYSVNEFGHGPHDDQGASVPALVAGGGGGRFKTGRYLRLRDINASNPRSVDNPVPTGRLLTSIARAMGHEIDYFGDPMIGADAASFPAFHGDLSEIYT